jgi:hypothetical protein
MQVGLMAAASRRLVLCLVLCLMLLHPLTASAASASGDPGALGTVRDSQQISVPESNRAYAATTASAGTRPADENLAKAMQPALDAAFSGSTVALSGDITQTGNTLYSKGQLSGNDVAFQVEFSGLGVALKAIADYNNGPVFSGATLPGSRQASMQGLYLPDSILQQARLDLQTVTLSNGQPSVVTMGFQIAAGLKFLDDKGLLIELADATVGLEYNMDSNKVSGVLGGALRVGPASAPVTFSVRGSLGTDPKAFEIVGTAEKIDFVAMLKAMSPKGFGDLPVPIDALGQFARVDLAKLTVRPLQSSVNFFATSALAAVEISFKENEVYTSQPKADPEPLEISTSLTGSYAKPPQPPPPPPPSPDTPAVPAASPSTSGSSSNTASTGLTGGYTKPAPPPKDLPPAGQPAPPAPVSRRDMGFMLALQPLPTFKFASVVPDLKIVDQLNFVQGAIVYSTFRGEARPDTGLAAFRNWSPTTLISPGLTVLVVADIKDLRQAKLDRALAGSGIGGKVANSFLDTAQVIVDASPVKQLIFRANVPKQISSLSLDLLATLATPRIGGVLDFRDLSISIKPLAMTVNIGGTIDMKLPKAVTSAERLIFTGGFGYEMPTTGVVSGAMKSEITDLFGVKGLRIGRAGFSAGLNFEADGIPIPDNMQIVGGLGLSFGRDRVVFDDASFALGFDINKPENLALVFNLDSLSWQNLITGFAGKNVLDRFDRTPGLKQILKTDLQDLQFQLALPGFTFVSPTGYSFTGTRIAGRGRIAGIGGRFDIAVESLQNPLVAEVELDKIKLPKIAGFETFVLSSFDGKGGPHASVNLTMANIGTGLQQPLVAIDGDLILLGSRSRTRIEFSGSEFSGATEGQIYGVLDGKLEFSGPSFENPLDSIKVKASLDVDKVGKKIMGVATRVASLGTVAVKLKSITFEGTLGALQAGAKAKVVIHINPPGGDSFDRTISVNIDAKDAANLIEDIGKQVGEEIKKITLVAVKAVAGAAGDVWEVVSGGPKVWGKTAAQIFAAVEDAFDPDDRKRLKLDGPQFRVAVQSTGNLMVPIGLDGKSGIRTMKSRGAAYFEETWQLVPSEEDGQFYLVSAWDGQDLNVKESSKLEGAQILLQKHKKKDKANEKLSVIPVEGQDGWVLLQFKHSGMYVSVNANGELVQSENTGPASMWKFSDAGMKYWGGAGPAPTPEQVAASVIVFQKENFTNAWLALHEGDNALGVPFANDVASIRVPKGYLVTLHDKFECTGKSSDLRLVTDANSIRGSGLQNDIACITVQRGALPADYIVRIFVQSNYGGVSRDLGEGKFPLDDTFRNRVNSLQVKPGYQATLHDKDDCSTGPKSLVVTSERPALAGTGLTDDVACVVVGRASAPAPAAAAAAPTVPVVVVYADPDFGGASQSMKVGKFVLSDALKNKVSSIRVPAGMRAVLFDKDDCASGSSLPVTADLPNLKGTGLDDDVACVIVSQ